MRNLKIIVVLLSLLSFPILSQTRGGDEDLNNNPPQTPASAKRARRPARTPGAPRKRAHAHAAYPLFNVEALDAQFEAVPEGEPQHEPRRELDFGNITPEAIEAERRAALETLQRQLLQRALGAFVLRGANPCGAQIGELGFSGF